MRFDERRFDGTVFIGATRAKGLWTNQVQTLHARVVRNGGRLNASASSHTLLSIALQSALSGITSRIVDNLLSKRFDNRTKPALHVKAIDLDFFPALTALMSNSQGPTLRAIRSLHQPLLYQMSRFTLVFETEQHNNAILSALEWTGKSIVYPVESEGQSPTLIPSVVNALGKNFHVTGVNTIF